MQSKYHILMAVYNIGICVIVVLCTHTHIHSHTQSHTHTLKTFSRAFPLSARKRLLIVMRREQTTPSASYTVKTPATDRECVCAHVCVKRRKAQYSAHTLTSSSRAPQIPYRTISQSLDGVHSKQTPRVRRYLSPSLVCVGVRVNHII